MTVNGTGLVAFGLYTGWRLLNFYKQTVDSGNKATMATDVIYMVVMGYLLYLGSIYFAYALILSGLFNVALGVILNMAPIPPEAMQHTDRLVTNLWLFTLIDVILGGLSYAIMITWGLI